MFSVANNTLKKVLKAAYNANQQDLEPGALENRYQSPHRVNLHHQSPTDTKFRFTHMVFPTESIYITRAPTDTKFRFTHMVFPTESIYITRSRSFRRHFTDAMSIQMFYPHRYKVQVHPHGLPHRVNLHHQIQEF